MIINVVELLTPGSLLDVNGLLAEAAPESIFARGADTALVQLLLDILGVLESVVFRKV